MVLLKSENIPEATKGSNPEKLTLCHIVLFGERTVTNSETGRPMIRGSHRRHHL